MSRLLAGRLALGGIEAGGWVELDGTVVAGAGHGEPPRDPDERVAGLLSPALVDLQVNGAGGREVTGDDDALDVIERTLLDHGVTRWLATLISTDDGTAEATVARLTARAGDPASTVAGIHLEGPFLSPGHRGMHRMEYLRAPADWIPAYLRAPAVRIMTLAPELPGAIELAEELAAAGVVVSLGHTGADAPTASRAVVAGARMVTHVLNAMGPLHQRAPGVAGVALTDDRLTVGLIADGVHVDPIVLDLVGRAAGDRVALVSDASPAASSPTPVATFAGVTLDPDGRLEGQPAGSLRLLDEHVVVWAHATGRSLAQALRNASDVPCALLGLPAPLSPGSPADLVEWSAGGRIARVMRGGDWHTPSP